MADTVLLKASHVGEWDQFMRKSRSVREWLPYEHRPVVEYINVDVLPHAHSKPNSFYVAGAKIVLIHDDEIAQHVYTNPTRRAEQITLLEAARIRKVDFKKGCIRLAAILAGFVALLQVVVWIVN